jgi:nucleoid DNA-binding protein
MKKPEIAKIMARQSGGTPGEAADRLDELVLDILHHTRQGKPIRLPGLGSFRAGRQAGRVAFRREEDRSRG